MCAGTGTRLRPFTEFEPKALLPVLGVPLAQFSVDTLAQARVNRIVANVHHYSDRAKEGLQALELDRTELLISDESELLMGSAGGIMKALPHFDGRPFFFMNADVLWGINLEALAQRHAILKKRWGVTMTLGVFPSGPRGERYREIEFDAETGIMTRLGDFAEGKPFFASIAVLEVEALEFVPRDEPADFLATILRPQIEKGRVGVFLHSSNCFDIGNPRVWLNTHMELIKRLETGDLPQLWRRRLERVNKRLAPGIWVSQDTAERIPSAQWVGPCYWNPLGDETAIPPQELGPYCVLYGTVSSKNLTQGIGWRGVWQGSENLD